MGVGRHKEKVAIGKVDVSCARRKEVCELPFAGGSIVACDFHERFDASWPGIPRIEIRSEHAIPRCAHSLKRSGALHMGIENLFVPAAHLGTPRVEVVGLVRVASVHAALGQIENGSRIVGIAFEFVTQYRAVAFVLIVSEIASAESTGLKVVLAAQSFNGSARFGANRVFMQDAAIFPGALEFEQLCAPVSEACADAHHVRVGIERIEVGFANKKIVSIHHQRVLGTSTAELKRFSSIVSEVHPFAFVKFSGDSSFGKVRADEVLGAVGGSGVDDAPGVDEFEYRVKGLGHDVGLVLDDHDKRNGGARGVSRGCPDFCLTGHGATLAATTRSVLGQTPDVWLNREV